MEGPTQGDARARRTARPGRPAGAVPGTVARAVPRAVPRAVQGAVLAAALAALAGCAGMAQPDATAARRTTWISYLNGDDLRASCDKGRADRYRLVFNADYNKHVRTYDVVGDSERGGAVVEARVLEASDLARLDPDESLTADRGAVERVQLTPRQFALFVLRLYQNGAFEPGHGGGMRPPSDGVYWLINGCRAGTWFFNAYPYPSDRFQDIRFAAPPPLPAAGAPPGR